MRNDDNEIAAKFNGINTAEEQEQERLLSQEQWTSLATDAYELRPESRDSECLKALQLPIVELVDRSFNRAKMSPLSGSTIEEVRYPELGKDLTHREPVPHGGSDLTPANVKEAQRIIEKSNTRTNLSADESDMAIQVEKGLLSGDPQKIGEALKKISDLRTLNGESAVRIEKQITEDFKRVGIFAVFDPDGGLQVRNAESKTFYLSTTGTVGTDPFDFGGGRYGGQLPQNDKTTPESRAAKDRLDFVSLGRVTSDSIVRDNTHYPSRIREFDSSWKHAEQFIPKK